MVSSMYIVSSLVWTEKTQTIKDSYHSKIPPFIYPRLLLHSEQNRTTATTKAAHSHVKHNLVFVFQSLSDWILKESLIECRLLFFFFFLILFLAYHLANFNQESPGGNQAGMKLFSWNNFNGCYMVITTLALALTAGIIEVTGPCPR